MMAMMIVDTYHLLHLLQANKREYQALWTWGPNWLLFDGSNNDNRASTWT